MEKFVQKKFVICSIQCISFFKCYKKFNFFFRDWCFPEDSEYECDWHMCEHSCKFTDVVVIPNHFFFFLKLLKSFFINGKKD